MNTPTPEIRKALYCRLQNALPIGPILPKDVAWPNSPFTPFTNRMYIAPFCLFSDTNAASLGSNGFERLEGIFQISIYGILNRGEADIEELARTLTDLYRAGTVLEVPGWNPVHIIKSYRTSLYLETGGSQLNREIPRTTIVVSANLNQFTQKGE